MFMSPHFRTVTLVAGFALALGVGLADQASAQVDVGFGGTPHDSSQPVEVTADSLTVDQAGGRAVFAGNVIVVQGDLRMAATTIEVVYGGAEGSRRVQEVIASGGVLVTRGADAAESQAARYAVDTAQLEMTGEVLVTQGEVAIAGDRMQIDMATGVGTVDGRVRTVLDAAGDSP